MITKKYCPKPNTFFAKKSGNKSPFFESLTSQKAVAADWIDASASRESSVKKGLGERAVQGGQI